MLRESVAIRKELQGPEHPDTGHALKSLGGLLVTTGCVQEGRRLLEEALGVLLPVLGVGHEEIGSCQMGIGQCCSVIGDYDGAELQYRTALACYEVRERAAGDRPQSSPSEIRLRAPAGPPRWPSGGNKPDHVPIGNGSRRTQRLSIRREPPAPKYRKLHAGASPAKHSLLPRHHFCLAGQGMAVPGKLV